MRKRTVYCYDEMTATFGSGLDSSDLIKIKFTKIIVPEEKEHQECAYYALKKVGVKTEELENLVNISEEGIRKTPILYKQTSFMNHKGYYIYIQVPSNILKIRMNHFFSFEILKFPESFSNDSLLSSNVLFFKPLFLVF